MHNMFSTKFFQNFSSIVPRDSKQEDAKNQNQITPWDFEPSECPTSSQFHSRSYSRRFSGLPAQTLDSGLDIPDIGTYAESIMKQTSEDIAILPIQAFPKSLSDNRSPEKPTFKHKRCPTHNIVTPTIEGLNQQKQSSKLRSNNVFNSQVQAKEEGTRGRSEITQSNVRRRPISILSNSTKSHIANTGNSMTKNSEQKSELMNTSIKENSPCKRHRKNIMSEDFKMNFSNLCSLQEKNLESSTLCSEDLKASESQRKTRKESNSPRISEEKNPFYTARDYRDAQANKLVPPLDVSVNWQSARKPGKTTDKDLSREYKQMKDYFSSQSQNVGKERSENYDSGDWRSRNILEKEKSLKTITLSVDDKKNGMNRGVRDESFKEKIPLINLTIDKSYCKAQTNRFPTQKTESYWLFKPSIKEKKGENPAELLVMRKEIHDEQQKVPGKTLDSKREAKEEGVQQFYEYSKSRETFYKKDLGHDKARQEGQISLDNPGDLSPNLMLNKVKTLGDSVSLKLRKNLSQNQMNSSSKLLVFDPQFVCFKEKRHIMSLEHNFAKFSTRRVNQHKSTKELKLMTLSEFTKNKTQKSVIKGVY